MGKNVSRWPQGSSFDALLFNMVSQMIAHPLWYDIIQKKVLKALGEIGKDLIIVFFK